MLLDKLNKNVVYNKEKRRKQRRLKTFNLKYNTHLSCILACKTVLRRQEEKKYIHNPLTIIYCRKMLIADINELKYQQEDAKKPNAEEEGEGKEDVTFLKLALK